MACRQEGTSSHRPHWLAARSGSGPQKSALRHVSGAELVPLMGCPKGFCRYLSARQLLKRDPGRRHAFRHDNFIDTISSGGMHGPLVLRANALSSTFVEAFALTISAAKTPHQPLIVR